MKRAALFLLLSLALCAALPAQDAADVYLDGLERLAAGEFDAALALISRAIDADPENVRYRIGRGAAWMFAEQPEKAIPDLDRAMALSSRAKEARMWRAAADRMCARFFTEVYPQSTTDPFESTVGDVAAFWGQTFRAVEQGYEPSPEKQAAMRARLADLRRQFVERASAGGDALQAAWRRAQRSADAGDWSGAAADVDRAFAAWPEDARVVYYQAGCRLALGDPYTARTLYTRALTFDTTFANAYLGRALAAEARPGTALSALLRGILARRAGEAPAARDAFVEATRLAPDEVEGWFHLAEAEAALGRQPEALAARGAPGAAPVTGDVDHRDARYAALCAQLELPYLRPTDRTGYTTKNMLSVAVRETLAAIDAPRTAAWKDGVAHAFGALARSHGSSPNPFGR